MYNQHKNNPKFLATTQLSQVIKLKNGGLFFRNAPKSIITSLELIATMFECNMFREIIGSNQYNYDQVGSKLISAPSECEYDCADTTYVTKSNHFNQIIYADFEAFTRDSAGNSIDHEDFMLCFASSTGYRADGRNIYTLTNWLESYYTNPDNVPEAKPIEVLCYFYNLNYDAQFIFNRYTKINE